MKKLLTLFVAIGTIAGFVSCGGKEDGDPNQIVIDDSAIGLLNGYYVNYSSGSGREDGITSHYMEMFITDGTLEFDANGVPTDCSGCDLEVYLDLYSSGTSFAGGEYTVWDWCSNGDLNGSWIEIENDDESILAYGHSGTVTVGGTAPNFNISFDFEVSDWNDYTGPLREDGCSSEYYAKVGVTGQFSKRFIEIDEENVGTRLRQ